MRETAGDALDNTTDVETPERIRFRHHVAGPMRRSLAYLFDVLIRGIVLWITALLVLGPAQFSSENAKASQGLWLVLLFVVDWGWNVLFETFWRGQTPGKRLLRLRVVRDGYPVGFLDSVLRNLLRAADFLPVGYLLGLLVMAGDRRFRRLGDRIAGTMVVIESQGATLAPIVLSPPATAQELAELPHRPPLSSDEREALEIYLRRVGLSKERRFELAEMVAPLLARRVGAREGDPVRFLALLHERAQGARRPADTAAGPGPAGPAAFAAPAAPTLPR